MSQVRQVRRSGGGRLGRWLVMSALAAAIFAADTMTDLEIAVAVFYVAVVLIAADFLSARAVIAVSAGCIVLTGASFLWTRTGASEAGVVNCVLSIGAILATTYLVLSRFRAIDAERQAHAQLARLARVNMLGEMTASIAHEVNQPLAGIATSAGAARRWLEADPPNLERARQALDRLSDDARRAGAVIARVRDLVGQAAPQGAWLQPANIVASVATLCASELDRNGVVLTLLTDDDMPLVHADEVQIQQVLLNLILNAMEAVSDLPPERRGIELSVRRTGGQGLEFALRDHGPGIAPDRLSRVFDAFETTKRGGMGIGLAVSRSIVERHGGRIWAVSPVGGGASIHFTLPSHLAGSP